MRDGQAGAVGDDLGDVGDGHRRGRPRILGAPQADAGGGGVHRVDRLVGQEAVADVARGELHRGPAGVLGQAHTVVLLVAPAQPLEDPDGLLDGGLVDGDRREPPLERGIGLHVAAVLVERRRPHDLQLAAGERRLEDVRRVHRPLDARARPDDGVQLVEEGHDPAVGGRDLVDEATQPLLELAAVLGARDQPGEVERHHPPAGRPGHRAGRDPRRDALDDRGLADARVPDEHGVVLGAPPEDLQDRGDLALAADDGVEAPGARRRGEVAPEPVEHRRAGVLAVAPRRRWALVGTPEITEALDEAPDQVLEGVGPLPGPVLVAAAGIVAHDPIMRATSARRRSRDSATEERWRADLLGATNRTARWRGPPAGCGHGRRTRRTRRW